MLLSVDLFEHSEPEGAKCASGKLVTKNSLMT